MKFIYFKLVHDPKVHFLIHHNPNLGIDEIATRLWGFGGAVLRPSAKVSQS